jgi:hypothetical protein
VRTAAPSWKILTIAIRALVHASGAALHSTDLTQFLASRTDGEAQLEAALSAIMASSELVRVGRRRLPSTRAATWMEAEKSLLRRAQNMTKRGDFQAVAVSRRRFERFPASRRVATGNARGKQVRDAVPAAGDTLWPSTMWCCCEAPR